MCLFNPLGRVRHDASVCRGMRWTDPAGEGRVMALKRPTAGPEMI
ncbi:hypothetical protein GMO_27220 [Gluconobacter morbifer G707]|uniref:Uncharacterized protein n=1 Tax=Gluconobacter morbifer G707 TaxID=1088869 RepID=G6XMK4_9PROT|nr:hypothetical protein GMO_27220 [Gluconobacter morbifer G707]